VLLESAPGAGVRHFDSAEDHGQLRRRDDQFLGRGGGKGVDARLESAELEGESVPHPSEDLEFVAAAILEDEEIAAERIALQDRPHHAGERVDPFTAIHGLDGHQNPAAGQ